ncbi:MAG: Luciferase-like monooxygenase [Frankiales bacterium]|nr:Luciferase-like monooxygenase [Frankiales bacterium]
MPPVDFAVIAPTAARVTADPDWMSAWARHVEACGFESVVVVEHTVVMRDYTSTYPYDPSGRMGLSPDMDVPDPLDLLAFLAARTSTLGLATGVLVLPNHHPVPLAKRVATVDALSGGRVRLCVGMGWMQEELEACGAPFHERGRRGDEQLQVLRKLWTGEPVDHEGEFFSFRGAACRPARRQVPIHIGGHSAAAARRAGRYGDGLQPLGISGEGLREAVDVMHRAAEDAGRDPSLLQLSLGHLVGRVDSEKAGKLEALGATRVVLDPSPTANLDEACDELSACAGRLGLST